MPATAHTLADRLRELVEAPGRREEIGAAGQAYATAVHAPAMAAGAALHVYAHAPRRERGVFEATAGGVRRIDLCAELPELRELPGIAASVPPAR